MTVYALYVTVTKDVPWNGIPFTLKLVEQKDDATKKKKSLEFSAHCETLPQGLHPSPCTLTVAEHVVS